MRLDCRRPQPGRLAGEDLWDSARSDLCAPELVGGLKLCIHVRNRGTAVASQGNRRTAVASQGRSD